MDGENNGKSYEQMDDLGGPPLFLETPMHFQGKHLSFRASVSMRGRPLRHSDVGGSMVTCI